MSKTIKQNATKIDYDCASIDDVYKHIERCARVCYASTSSTNGATPDVFVRNLIRRGHMTPLEHATIWMVIPYTDANFDVVRFYQRNKYSFVSFVVDSFQSTMCAYVTTNFRVIVENDKMCDVERFMTQRRDEHEQRVTIEFDASIATMRELNRYRTHSICEQSTRYCNYANDKFENQLTFCESCDDDDMTNALNDEIERVYMARIARGARPESARNGLSLNLATHAVHTATLREWKHFLDQRAGEATGKVAPDMRALAFIVRDIIDAC